MSRRNFMDLSKEEYLNLLETMYLIRFFEEAAGQFYRKGLVKGGIHTSIGQEAVEVGICSQLEISDYITSTHRGHGHHIAKGANIDKLLAEILGKEDGYCKGRGGSMHVAAFDVGSLGAFPVVAAGVPAAIGAGLSAVLKKKNYIVASFFGDGALGQGTLYECLNLAAVWKLPVIFVCENNQYAVSTNCENSLAIKDFAAMAEGHGLKSYKVDGQHIDKVYDCANEAIGFVRNNHCPVFIYAETYRFEGHYFGEPEVYRDRNVVRKIRESRDPILLYINWLNNKYGPEIKGNIQGKEKDAIGKIESAKQFALNSQNPDPDTYSEFVYA